MAKETPSSLPPTLDAFTLGILEAIPSGIILYNQSLHIIHANPVVRQWLPSNESLVQCLAMCTEADSAPDEGWIVWLEKPFTETHYPAMEGVVLINAGRPRWVRMTSHAIGGSSQTTPSTALLSIEDMGQLARVRQKLDHQERLAALGRIASEVAHELNSPLDGILRYLNLTTRAIEEHRVDKSQEYLDRCRKGLRRMVHIVGELLEHARLPRKPYDTSPLSTIFDDALHTVAAKSHAENIEVKVRLAPTLPDVHVSRLYQVMCNVFRNAYDAMPQGGRLTIVADQDSKGMLAIMVSDTGHGINEEDLERVFDPFFTTKDTGTGLGLAVSKDIIQGSGGTIKINSQLGEGTTVLIHLPLAQRS